MSKSHRSDDLWARPGEVSRSLFNKQMKNNSPSEKVSSKGTGHGSTRCYRETTSSLKWLKRVGWENNDRWWETEKKWHRW